MVAAFSLLAGLLTLGCLVVGAYAVNFNFDAFSDPLLTLQYSGNYQLARWFNLLDMLGYYLLLLPIAFYLQRQFKYNSPWTSLLTCCGIGYIFVGAIGAALLAAVWPELMKAYLIASTSDQEQIARIFSSVTIMVVTGMWNILETLLSAVWWIGIGSLMYKEKKALGLFTIVTGMFTLLDSIGNMLEIKTMSEVGMNGYLVFAIVWPIWMAVYLLKEKGSSVSEHNVVI